MGLVLVQVCSVLGCYCRGLFRLDYLPYQAGVLTVLKIILRNELFCFVKHSLFLSIGCYTNDSSFMMSD